MEIEQVHDLSPWAWWEQLAQDARHALRVFRRSPAFAVTAVLMLALGVGANGAMFSVVDALVLRPLPVTDPNALVVVRDSENGNFSYPDYVSLRGDGLLSALVASSSLLRVPVAISGEAEKASVKIVTANYFEGLGVAAGVGRLMGGGEDAAPLAVLSDGYWTRRFARAPDVLGRQITVSGAMLTIVGIAPPGFFGDTPGESPEVWASMAAQRPFSLNERGFA
jgi:putative ABC transport system permease protein